MAKIDTLKDNFNDNSFDTAKWEKFESAATLREQNGRLEFDYTNAGPPSGASIAIDSLSPYDLAGSSILLEVQTIGTGDSVRANIGCVDYATFVGVFLSSYSYNGLLVAEYLDQDFNSTEVASVTYNAVAHRWWRIRETGGTIYFDTSPNGIKWNNLGSVAKATVEAAIGVSIGALTVDIQVAAVYLGTLTSTDAIIDNVNCPPRLLSLTGAGV